MPYLPALIGDAGPLTASVRHDWGKTLTELANERFLAPLHDWAQQHHTLIPLPNLRVSTSHSFEQPLCGSPRRRRQGIVADVAGILRPTLGGFGGSSFWQSCDLVGNLDVVALSGISRHPVWT